MKVTINDHTPEVLAEKYRSIIMGLTTIGLIAEGYAKVHLEQTPRRIDTGRLRNSVTYRVDANKTSVAVGTNVEYGRYVEFGTSKMKPNNFLRSAIGDHMQEWKSIIEKALEK